MKKLNLIVASLLSITAISPALAHNNRWHRDWTPPVVTTPVFDGNVLFGFQGFWGRPSGPDLTYATAGELTAQHSQEINPYYTFGYHADLGYLFANTSNDLIFSYTTLRTSNSASASGPVILPIIDVGALTHANASAKFRAWHIELTGGQHLDIGNTHLRLFAGGEYGHIHNDFDIDYNTTLLPPSADVLQDSTFFGGGPRVGADACYALGCGFGIDASFASALLIGKADGRIQVDGATTLRPHLLGDVLVNDQLSSVTRIVPNLFGKLGLSYHYMMGRTSEINVGIGYQVDHYFNAIDRAQIASTGLATGTIFARSSQDLSIDGPYFNVIVVI